jgi:glyoxylase-like metal-dependent hydrolase (beta-lactamase superfamily II)
MGAESTTSGRGIRAAESPRSAPTGSRLSRMFRVRSRDRAVPREIARNVFEIRLRRVRAHLIAEDSLTLIDAGLPGSSGAIDQAITALGRSPSELRRVVCTHGHFDHAGGAAELGARSGVEVLMHPADLANLGTTLGDVARRPSRRLFVALTPPLDHATALADGDVLPALGGVRVVHVPGHTPGSICLYAPAAGLLFVGDALQARLGRVGFASRLYSDDWRQARASVQRLATLDVRLIVFSHYAPERDHPNALLQRLATQAQRGTEKLRDRPG